MRKAFLGLLISLVFGSFVLVSAKPRPKRIHFKSGQADICLHGVDLTHPAERLQMTGEIGAPHGNTDAIAAPCQRAHDVPAKEA